MLFVDELHTVVGAGKAEGAMDAGNLLKPMLARGELHMIGATTLDEYRKYIEKDAALERRFAPVMVDQPSVEDTISILRGLKEKYEAHHGVRIKDAALVAAATMSNRYISDRFLPDKAIDLVDEAAAKLRTEIDSMPQELDEVSRRVMQLEIEREALRKENDSASRRRLEQLEKELAELREDQARLRVQWDAEKNAAVKLRGLREQIEQTKVQIEQAERQYDLNRVAELRYGTLAQLQKELAAEEEASLARKDGARLSKEEVDEDDIAGVIARWTGIPVSKLLEGEKQKLLHLEDELHKRVIGQNEAVDAVAEAVLALALGARRSESPDRLVHLPRSDRRREDRACASAGRVSLRRRARADPHRHVGVPGEAHRRAAARRAARIRRLRRGRSADRSRAPPSVFGDSLRRDREGAPRRLQRLPADSRRRAPDRRSGAHGRL